MRSKEYIRMLKRKLNKKKELAHRKKIEGKTNSGKKNVERTILEDIMADKTDGYASSHLILKAKALAGPSAFLKLNKATLHCLFRIYDIEYVSRKTKSFLCKMLQERILQLNAIPRPDRVQGERFAQIKKNHQNKREVDDYPDSMHDAHTNDNEELTEPLALMEEEMVTVSTEPSSNPLISCAGTDTSQRAGPCGDVNGSIPNAHVQQLSENRPRRKKFKPTNEQLSLLRQDHDQKTNKTVNLKRAHDFGVHVSQIENWHKRYRKLRRTSPGDGMWDMCIIHGLLNHTGNLNFKRISTKERKY